MSDEYSIADYDMRVLEHQQAQAKRKHERTMERIRSVTGVGVATAVAAGVVGVAFIVWQGVAGPSASEQIADRQQRECIAQRGTWVVTERGQNSGEATGGTCIFGQEDLR